MLTVIDSDSNSIQRLESAQDDSLLSVAPNVGIKAKFLCINETTGYTALIVADSNGKADVISAAHFNLDRVTHCLHRDLTDLVNDCKRNGYTVNRLD
jgi:hypothetical protein